MFCKAKGYIFHKFNDSHPCRNGVIELCERCGEVERVCNGRVWLRKASSESIRKTEEGKYRHTTETKVLTVRRRS